jgi:trimethylamine---corrinoid protein Co-methyltransferase
VFDICPSPPLKWTHISSQNIIDCARYGLPIETVSMPMPGAATPATLCGSMLVDVAETLSGLVLAQCVNPGTPVIYGGAPCILICASVPRP